MGCYQLGKGDAVGTIPTELFLSTKTWGIVFPPCDCMMYANAVALSK